MACTEIHEVVILGSGNVATRLSAALNAVGFQITQIYSRTLMHAKSLASKFNCNFTDKLSEIDLNADLYLLCVSDDALNDVIKNIPIKDALIVHTSGTTSIDVFNAAYSNFGVFYPVQTFSKDKEIDFLNIPICIEASNQTNELKLATLAGKISNNVQVINSAQRKTLHVAAVFASNFTNYFYLIANDILNKKELSFDLLKPLITEVASKIIKLDPKSAQTGPAKRGDDQIILTHLEYLNSQPEYQEIYKLISAHIKQKFSK